MTQGQELFDSQDKDYLRQQLYSSGLRFSFWLLQCVWLSHYLLVVLQKVWGVWSGVKKASIQGKVPPSFQTAPRVSPESQHAFV